MDNLTIREGFVGQRMITLPAEVKLRLRHNPITQFFYLTDLGHYPHAINHYRARKEGAGEYIFIYCTEGEGRVTVGDRTTDVKPNQFVIIPKGVKHTYGSRSRQGWSIYWMHFDGDVAVELYKRYRLHTELAVSVPFVQRHLDVFNQAYEIFNGSTLDLQIEYACLTCLDFLKAFVYQDVDTSVVLDQQQTLVNKVKTFLNKSLDQSLSAAQIAAQFKYSASHLAYVFKRHTGYSVIGFFNLKKIQKACEYLAYTNLSIKEISFKIAFDDPLYFSRVFKKFMGVSPRNYRQKTSIIRKQ